MSSFDQYSQAQGQATATATATATSSSSSSSPRSTPRRPPLRLGMSYAPPPLRSSPVRSFSLPSTPRQTPTRRASGQVQSQAQGQGQGQGLGLAFGTPEMGEKEVYMGALVSPVQMNEKRSIDVPCIILTEPDQYLPPSRTVSPPPKQIILLPSSSLALPLHSSGTNYDQKRSGSGWKGVIKTVVVFGAVGLGLWHVWSVLGQFDVEHGQAQFENQI